MLFKCEASLGLASFLVPQAYGQACELLIEANSYLLQCTLGSSHNQCTFCGTYKDKPYRIRPMSEIKTDIRMP